MVQRSGIVSLAFPVGTQDRISYCTLCGTLISTNKQSVFSLFHNNIQFLSHYMWSTASISSAHISKN